jgi:TrmH family RNA methyltransferase
VITSLQNDRVKLIRALQSSGKSRRRENRLVLEGVRLIGDALAAGIAPDFVFFTADTADIIAGDADQVGLTNQDQPTSRLFRVLQERSVPTLEVSPEVMAHIADTQTPQGVIAVTPMPEVKPPASVDFALILDSIADPGNLGTILRTAAAAGTHVVILAPHCVDPFNPKVLRGGMGAHFRIPILRLSWSEITREYGSLPMYLADAAGDTVYYDVDWTQPSALIVGGEARGADLKARQQATTLISIPMENEAESLNAGIAAGVILFEVRRQRAKK